MHSDPFTIRIFVPDGDPEGVRIIDRMNWTGQGIVFPRSKWADIRKRPDLAKTGVYILVGYKDEDDDLPTIYIGQADGVGNRIESHVQKKDFWDWGVVFVSTSGGLNRAHVTWLEYALVKRAHEAKRCYFDNGNVPQEPAMTEAEKADTQGFLKEMLQILPLVGLRSFEYPKAVAIPKATGEPVKASSQGYDTIIVPAQKEGFEERFLGAGDWYAIRISGGMLDKIKYIAAYQTTPVSAITHYAPVDRIEPYGEGGKYKLVFSEKAKPIGPIRSKTMIPSFLGHKAVSRFFCIVQKNERYFGTKPYAPKKLDFGKFMALFSTKKLIYEIKIPNLLIELSFVV